jgi:hypothetical protein
MIRNQKTLNLLQLNQRKALKAWNTGTDEKHERLMQ